MSCILIQSLRLVPVFFFFNESIFATIEMYYYELVVGGVI